MYWCYIILAIALSLLLLIFLLYIIKLTMILPNKKRVGVEKYKSQKFAHRGLHDSEHAENSLSAFKRAIDEKFGIEFDIRLSSDGQLVVFHDANMERVCGVDELVVNKTVDELHQIKLANTEETIPTFKEVLSLVNGQVPLLIEIKMEGKEKGVAERFIEEIEGYKGEFIVESFNPVALRKVRKARPDIIRGVLSMEFKKEKKYKGKLLYTLLEKLYFNFLSRPDFIAYEKKGYEVYNLRMLRKERQVPLFAWTIRSEEEEKEAIRRGFDTVIFENYIPEEK